jgi:predicted dehydrogenase
MERQLPDPEAARPPEPLAVGLVGAGPWATMVTAPALAAGPRTRLAGVWARRPEAAAELARRHGTEPVDDLDALFERCEAVAFSVPPAVQADLAVRAAAAGKHLLLEKPLGPDLASAARLAEATADAGVASLVVLTWRYAPAVRSFLARVGEVAPVGGRGLFVSGGALGGPFAPTWRTERGPLLDLGPHVVDLLDAALGPVIDVRAHGTLLGWVGLLLEHEGGASSEVSLCATSAIQPARAAVEVYGRHGLLTVDCVGAVDAGTFTTVAAELATVAHTGEPHPLDVDRGLHLQQILHEAERQLTR